jgi:hypothetical protein
MDLWYPCGGAVGIYDLNDRQCVALEAHFESARRDVLHPPMAGQVYYGIWVLFIA